MKEIIERLEYTSDVEIIFHTIVSLNIKPDMLLEDSMYVLQYHAGSGCIVG